MKILYTMNIIMVESKIFYGIIILLVIIIFLMIKLIINNKKLSKEKKEEMGNVFNTFEKTSKDIPIGFSAVKDFNEVLFVNAKYQEITGRSRAEFDGKSWINYTHPDDLEKDMQLFKKFKNKEIKSYSLEKRYIKPDGSSTWVNLTLSYLDLKDGNHSYYVTMFEDINDRKIAEEKLIESERSKSLLLSNLPGIAYRSKLDREWTMEFLSEGCYDLTGYKSEELINNKSKSFNEIIESNYREKVWNKWKEAAYQNKKISYEYPIITKKKERKWVLEKGQAIYDSQGEVEALEGLIIDISDRKKREEKIEYLYNHDYLTGLYNRNYLEKIKIKYNKEKFHPISVVVCDINGLKLINDAFGQEEGDKCIKETARTLENFLKEKTILARTGGDDFTFILLNTNQEKANRLSLKIKNEFNKKEMYISDKIFKANISIGQSTKEKMSESLDDVILEAENSMKKSKILDVRSSHSSILASIKATMYEKSQETEEHGERLLNNAERIGNKLNLAQDQIDDLVLSANLHDLGKVGIDNQILSKPSKLNRQEWEEIKKHPEIGYRIALSSPDIAGIAEYILSHHERWDGKGYPQGLKAEEIPLISRILSIVDAYDAMTSPRPYNVAKDKEEAIRELEINAGKQFDPTLVKIFIEILKNEKKHED